MKDELPGKIAKWLRGQGYPLEMIVAAALRKENFYTNQGFYYSDPETNTSREIDIIATKMDTFGLFQVQFVVECKSSLDKPWVLFTSDSNELGKNIFNNYAMLSKLAQTRSLDINSLVDSQAKTRKMTMNPFLVCRGSNSRAKPMALRQPFPLVLATIPHIRRS